MNNALIWFGIALCVFQSALFSGSSIAVFSLSRPWPLTVCDVAM